MIKVAIGKAKTGHSLYKKSVEAPTIIAAMPCRHVTLCGNSCLDRDTHTHAFTLYFHTHAKLNMPNVRFSILVAAVQDFQDSFKNTANKKRQAREFVRGILDALQEIV